MDIRFQTQIKTNLPYNLIGFWLKTTQFNDLDKLVIPSEYHLRSWKGEGVVGLAVDYIHTVLVVSRFLVPPVLSRYLCFCRVLCNIKKIMYKISNFVMNFYKITLYKLQCKRLFLGFIFTISASSMKTEKIHCIKKQRNNCKFILRYQGTRYREPKSVELVPQLKKFGTNPSLILINSRSAKRTEVMHFQTQGRLP